MEVTLQGNKHMMINSNFPLLSGMICMIGTRLVQRYLQNGSGTDIEEESFIDLMI